MMAVYKIFNRKSGRLYVGSTVDFAARRLEHLHHLRKGKHHSPILQNAWNKHGEASFGFEVIDNVTDVSSLIEREQYWMDKLRPYYNCSPTAGSPLGTKHTEVSKYNMSVSHKGKSLLEMGHKEDCVCTVCRVRRGETIGNKHPLYGKCRDKKTKAKIADKLRQHHRTHIHPMTGKSHSESAKEKLRAAFSIPVIQCDLEGQVIRTWESSKKAAQVLELQTANICACLKRRAKTTGGFTWKYAETKIA